MSELAGKWRHVRDEKFGDYLKAIGVGFMKRKVVEFLHPDVTITVNDKNEWSVRTQTNMSDQTVSFTVGEEYETNVKGVVEGMMRCLATYEDGKLAVDAKPCDSDGCKPTQTVREVVDGEMVQTMTCGSVVCKRYHTRLE